MTGAQARERFATARVARLATVGSDGAPHVVPIVFALDGETIVHAVDQKPKRTRDLRRLANIADNPRVAVLADEYDEARRALDLLAERYAQYRAAPPAGPVVAVDVARWRGWSAAG